MFENQGDFMFSIIPIFIGIIAVIVFGTILVILIKGISTWNKNNHQPRINSKAKVVTKRTGTRGGKETNSYSQYFVTFEFESGDRVEFQVTGEEYGQLVEGDNGEIQFQGTRYLGYTRTKFQ